MTDYMSVIHRELIASFAGVYSDEALRILSERIVRARRKRGGGMTIHIYPVNDLLDHNKDSDNCICGPAQELINNEWLVIHHALDGRR